MANVDISSEIAAISSAVYGEEVRGSIKTALQKMVTSLNTAIGTQVIDVESVEELMSSEALSLKYSTYTELTEGTDLNAYAGTANNYWIPYAKAQVLNNMPVTRAGRLFVFPAKGSGTNDDGGIQLFITSQNVGAAEGWIRGWKGQTWTSWSKIATSEDIYNIKNMLNHTERGFDLDKSAFSLGYKKCVDVTFVVGGVKSNGELQITTTSRARTGYLYLNGSYRIRNLSNARFAVQILRITIGTSYDVMVEYTTDANIDYTFSSSYAYIIQIKDTQNESLITQDSLKVCNDQIFITSGTFDISMIIPLSCRSNLFDDLSAGNANPNSGSINTDVNYKHTGYVSVKSGEVLCVTSNYCNVCFYDSSKVFVSGVAINNGSYSAIGTRHNPYSIVQVPDKASYAVFATYAGEYDRLVITRVPGATLYPAEYDLISQYVPERNIIRDKSACLYDANLEKLESYPSSYLSGSMNSFVPGIGYTISSGTIRPYMYTTMERSKISAIFTLSANSIIRFGYDSSNSGIGDTTIDSMIVCIIDSESKTLVVRKWNWTSETMGAKIAEATFNFNMLNGHRYCISVEKDTVYHVTAKLYDCDCPGEVATAEFRAEYASSTEIINNYVRAWGCGRFTVISGNVTLKRFSMWSTGNAHPKIYIVGDSFVEHAGRNPMCGWPQRLYQVTNGDVFLSGRGGAKADNVMKRLPFELNVCHPQYGIIKIGTNDSAGAYANVTTFKNNLLAIIEILKRENIIPVLVTISRRTDSDNLLFIQETNPWIKSLGYLYIDEAMVMSTGDGVTQDTSKYQNDGIHPTIAGGKAVFEWIEANLPELIY